jgi:hypothetical protein
LTQFDRIEHQRVIGVVFQPGYHDRTQLNDAMNFNAKARSRKGANPESVRDGLPDGPD